MSPESPESGSPAASLFARVKKYAFQTPFVPFRIVTTSGRSYDVPKSDHIGLVPVLQMITVVADSLDSTDIHALHVAAVEPVRRPRRKRAA